MKLDDLNWEDVRFFAAASRSHSYRQAAERLHSTHPTVRRRVASLESATGLTLFQRDVPGLLPTMEGQELLEVVQGVEGAMARFARRARAADAAARGPVSVTLPMPIALTLAPAFAAFTAKWPEIVLTVQVSDTIADLGAMEADVAIRALQGGTQPDPSLAGRRAVVVERAAYGLPGVRHWIASSGDPAWRDQTPFPGLPVRVVMADGTLRLEACRRGMGMAMLPCFMGDPHLPRHSEPEPGYEVWVLVHPDMRRNPRLRLFRDAMVEALKEAAWAQGSPGAVP